MKIFRRSAISILGICTFALATLLFTRGPISTTVESQLLTRDEVEYHSDEYSIFLTAGNEINRPIKTKEPRLIRAESFNVLISNNLPYSAQIAFSYTLESLSCKSADLLVVYQNREILSSNLRQTRISNKLSFRVSAKTTGNLKWIITNCAHVGRTPSTQLFRIDEVSS